MQIIWRSTTVIAPHGVPIPTLKMPQAAACAQQDDCTISGAARPPFVTRVRISLSGWNLR